MLPEEKSARQYIHRVTIPRKTIKRIIEQHIDGTLGSPAEARMVVVLDKLFTLVAEQSAYMAKHGHRVVINEADIDLALRVLGLDILIPGHGL